ncbi:DUF1080 domain-containing protein [Verrucomicrobiaceae bacterium N1E253]|uniref:DUF1080 domain-containing protein n=1 Tax=Oceaniferula marina TaxID=2748318 RepID=A0A851GET0_9BACT|nr:DUF1080 domain-containing protein [Oceaniferula marina]NWK55926.1 DUF1080 domain-containing protein [Oceaniferula marina]
MKLTIKACVVAALALATAQAEEKKDGWIQLFNGKDLSGWTPKFKGEDLGVNYKNTFRVEDGLLTVSYDKYDKWQNNFGHLFYKKEFSHYILRAEYRFIGDQVKGGPGWAFRNNGFMIHGQTPESMKKDQSFPNSIEVQLLGGKPDGTGKRTNLNLCTPGTHVVIDGKLQKRHVINSDSKTYHGDQWVTVEVEVKGSEVIRHKIDGKVVLEYNKPQLDDGTLLEKGTISIQAESHPIQFRKIEVKEVKK